MKKDTAEEMFEAFSAAKSIDASDLQKHAEDLASWQRRSTSLLTGSKGHAYSRIAFIAGSQSRMIGRVLIDSSIEDAFSMSVSESKRASIEASSETRADDPDCFI